MLIDCGEGTQMQLRRFNLKAQRIGHIFISHLHGDHYLGLMGLLSSMHLFGRNAPLHLYGPVGLSDIITVQLHYSQTVLQFPVHFHELQHNGPTTIFEDDTLTVSTLPLQHRIPCNGFLFQEKPKTRNLNKNMPLDQLDIDDINQLKAGQSVLDSTGNIKYDVAQWAHPPKKHRSYAFCSDTRYIEALAEQVKKVDLLYHEATFTEEFGRRAAETYHSTARQAATIAQKAEARQLVIGHFSTRYRELDPLLTEAQSVFPETILAKEGLQVDVPE